MSEPKMAYVNNGSVPEQHDSAAAAADPGAVQLLAGALAVVAGMEAAVAGEAYAVHRDGDFDAVCASGVTFSKGDEVYWDVSNETAVTATASGALALTYRLGTARAAKLSGELSVRVKLENFQIKGRGLSGVQELVEATGNLLNHGVSLVSGESAAVTATLPDGDVIGQQKLVYVTNVDNAVVLSVTSHGTSDPESFTAGAAGQSLLLVWDGTVWQTVAGNLPTT